jgi:acetylornithine deacetylase/succinyl-diaminopimelate desuccinylase-like protein
VRIEIRVVPDGPSADAIESRLRELASVYDADVELVEDSVEPFESDIRGPLVEAMSMANARTYGSRPPLVGVPAWTDAHNFVELAGSQALVWGPGDFGLAHDPSEEIEVHEVVIAARVIQELLVDLGKWLS